MTESAAPKTSSRQPRTDWRLGSRTVRRWREWTLAWALIGLGLGALAGSAVEWLWDWPLAPVVATGLVWAGMLVPVIRAFSRSTPVGLLRFRPIDLLWALGLAVALRIVQGWLAAALDADGSLPSYPLIDGQLPAEWWFTSLVAPVVVAPLVEEFFFRGVLLVSIFTLLRRPLGQLSAGVVAGLASTGLFVLAHTVTATLGPGEILSVAALGAVCSALVLLTGRLWVAVLTHAIYNVSFVSIALLGTYL
jgi:hypothetical protein